MADLSEIKLSGTIYNLKDGTTRSHVAKKDNPHEVTKAQVGLGNVDNTSDANKPISTAMQSALDNKYEKPSTGIPNSDLSESVQASLVKADSALQKHQDITGKVDKVEGKGLSTNDYTNTDKAKVASALTEHQDISGKQNTLTTVQMQAVNSGITAAKVGVYDSMNTRLGTVEERATSAESGVNAAAASAVSSAASASVAEEKATNAATSATNAESYANNISNKIDALPEGSTTMDAKVIKNEADIEQLEIEVCYKTIDITQLTAYSYIILETGYFSESTRQQHYALNVASGETYKIYANDNSKVYYAFLTNNVSSSAGAPNYVDGESTHRTISNGESLIITIPEGCNILYITKNTQKDTTSYDATPKMVLKKVDKISQIENNASIINEHDNKIAHTEIVLSVEDRYGYYITQENIYSDTSTYNHYGIEVTAGEVYKITAQDNASAFYALLADHDRHSNTSPNYAPGETGRYKINEGTSVNVTIPYGCTILYIAALYKSDMTPKFVGKRTDRLSDIETCISELKGDASEVSDISKNVYSEDNSDVVVKTKKTKLTDGAFETSSSQRMDYFKASQGSRYEICKDDGENGKLIITDDIPYSGNLGSEISTISSYPYIITAESDCYYCIQRGTETNPVTVKRIRTSIRESVDVLQTEVYKLTNSINCDGETMPLDETTVMLKRTGGILVSSSSYKASYIPVKKGNTIKIVAAVKADNDDWLYINTSDEEPNEGVAYTQINKDKPIDLFEYEYTSNKDGYLFVSMDKNSLVSVSFTLLNVTIKDKVTMMGVVDNDYELQVLSDNQESYWTNVEYDTDYSYSYIDSYANSNVWGGSEQAKSKILNIPVEEGCTLEVADNPAFANGKYDKRTYSPVGGKCKVYNLIPNRIYYYRVKDSEGVEMKRGVIKTKGSRRTLRFDGCDGNFRDLGGIKTQSGATVKYGKVIRGTSLIRYDSDAPTTVHYTISDAGREELAWMKVTAELNLGYPTIENNGNNRTLDMSGEGTFKFISFHDFNGRNTAHFMECLTYIRDCVKSGENVYMHCEGGMDRTGLMSWLLLAVLGCSRSTLDKDYEFTSFRSTSLSHKRNGTSDKDAKYIAFQNEFTNKEGVTVKEKMYNWLINAATDETEKERRRVVLDELNELLLE